MTQYKEKIVDAITDEVTWRDYTEAEIAEVEKAQAEGLRIAQAAAETQAKREAALSKLAALGLNADDIKALGI